MLFITVISCDPFSRGVIPWCRTPISTKNAIFEQWLSVTTVHMHESVKWRTSTTAIYRQLGICPTMVTFLGHASDERQEMVTCSMKWQWNETSHAWKSCCFNSIKTGENSSKMFRDGFEEKKSLSATLQHTVLQLGITCTLDLAWHTKWGDFHILGKYFTCPCDKEPKENIWKGNLRKLAKWLNKALRRHFWNSVTRFLYCQWSCFLLPIGVWGSTWSASPKPALTCRCL